eukprot:gene1677-biopygen13912
MIVDTAGSEGGAQQLVAPKMRSVAGECPKERNCSGVICTTASSLRVVWLHDAQARFAVEDVRRRCRLRHRAGGGVSVCPCRSCRGLLHRQLHNQYRAAALRLTAPGVGSSTARCCGCSTPPSRSASCAAGWRRHAPLRALWCVGLCRCRVLTIPEHTCFFGTAATAGGSGPSPARPGRRAGEETPTPSVHAHTQGSHHCRGGEEEEEEEEEDEEEGRPRGCVQRSRFLVELGQVRRHHGEPDLHEPELEGPVEGPVDGRRTVRPLVHKLHELLAAPGLHEVDRHRRQGVETA